MMGPVPFCTMSPCSGDMKVEEAPFAPAIVRCYLAIPSIEHNLSQKLDLKTVAIAAIANRVSNSSVQRIVVIYITSMPN